MIPSPRWYVDQNNPFKFGLLKLRNPNNILETPPFTITIYDGPSDKIAEVNGLTYTATPGSLGYLQIFPENFKTSNQVPYEFSFETKNPLDAFSDIQIVLPNEIELNKDSLAVTPLTTDMQTRVIGTEVAG